MNTITYHSAISRWLLLPLLLCISLVLNAQHVKSKKMVKNEIVYLLHNNVVAGSREALIEIGEPVYQINTGGWETQGAWERDTQANPSPYVGFTFYRTANGINWNQFFLKKSRVSYSNMEWDFPVENGGYVVTLYFVESPETSQVVGSRVFDVTIEGRKALEDFDILHYAGSGSPVSFNFYVSVSDNNIDLNFLVEEGSALISAIEISKGVMTTQDPILSQSSRALVKTMQEGTELRIPIRATDFDSPSSAIHIFGGDTGEPIGFETVIDYGNGHGEMILRPRYDDAGNYLLFIASEDEDGLETGCNACWALVELTVEDTPEESVLYRVNAGGWTDVDDTPIPWMEDSYLHPSPYTYTGYVTQAHAVLSNTTDAPDEIFDRSKVSWNSSMIWNFPVANGYYTVDMYFAESYFNASGGRIFDILAEGQLKFPDVDIFSEVGRNAPLQKTLTTQVSDGSLTILLRRELANPMIAGIAVTYNGENPPSVYAPENLNFAKANEQIMMTVMAYPNPVETEMTLLFPRDVKGTIAVRLIDKGNQVRLQAVDESDVSRDKATFSVDPGLPAGIYLAEVAVGDYKQYVKIIKK